MSISAPLNREREGSGFRSPWARERGQHDAVDGRPVARVRVELVIRGHGVRVGLALVSDPATSAEPLEMLLRLTQAMASPLREDSLADENVPARLVVRVLGEDVER